MSAPTCRRLIRRSGRNRLQLQTLENRIAPAVYIVNQAGDVVDGNYGEGQFSLREAINLSNTNAGADTINFNLASGTIITLTSGFSISDSLTIAGPGADQLTIDANKTGRHFTVDANKAITISGLTLRNGSVTSSGGSIFLGPGDTATLDSVWLTANTASGTGGAIAEDNSVSPSTIQLTLKKSTLSGNSAASTGGAIYFLRGMTLNIQQSTISSNTASSGGAIGGLTTNSGVIAIAKSTITGNSATVAGGIRLSAAAYSASILNIDSTIIASNTGGDIPAYVTANYSLIGIGSGSSIAGSGNIVGSTTAPINPQLHVLSNYGGPTPTHALKVNSPAINTGAGPGGFLTDQRGFPLEFNADMGSVTSLIRPPTVATVIFGDGTNQRSLVKQMVVKFSQSVTFTGSVPSAFTLHRSGPGGTVGDVVLGGNANSGPVPTIATITFSGSLTDPGLSLVDGLYDLTVSAAQVASVGLALDGNNDGIAGGSYYMQGTSTPNGGNRLFRLFGDSDGNGTVNQLDFAAFATAFGVGPTTIFDFDNNGFVGQSDFIKMRNRFGLTP